MLNDVLGRGLRGRDPPGLVSVAKVFLLSSGYKIVFASGTGGERKIIFWEKIIFGVSCPLLAVCGVGAFWGL